MGQVALNSQETGNQGSPARAPTERHREHKENPSSGLHTTGRRCQVGKRWTARSRCLNRRFHRPQRNLWKGGGGGGCMCVHTSNRGSRVSEDVSSVPTGGVKIPGKNKENKIPEVRLAAYVNCASADTLDSQTQRLGFV